MLRGVEVHAAGAIQLQVEVGHSEPLILPPPAGSPSQSEHHYYCTSTVAGTGSLSPGRHRLPVPLPVAVPVVHSGP